MTGGELLEGFGSDMNNTPKERAIRTFWAADYAVQETILEQAGVHIQARLQTATALEARVTSVAAFMLAGAAVAAQIAWSVKGQPAFLAGLASIAFAAGGIVAFAGVRAGNLAIPGPDPAWWGASEKEVEGFSGVDAKAWVIGHMVDAIASLDDMATRRADALNYALGYGAGGSVLIALAGTIAMFR